MSSPQPTSAPSSRPSAAGEDRPAFRSRLRCCAVPVFGVAWLVTAVVFALVLTRPANTARARWDQPNTVSYQSNDPYVLCVKENSSWWNEFNRCRHCRVEVTSHHNVDIYGHATEYEFHNYQNEPDYFTRCTVIWEPEGVTIAEPTGHKLFIPKKAFIGGR